MDCCSSGSQKEPKSQHQAELSAGQAKNNSSANGKGFAKNSLILGVALLLIAGMTFGYLIKPSAPSEDHLAMIKNKSIDQQREAWIEIADNIRGELAMQGEYDCCLENPCWYCIQKTPGHGEEATCECRQNILDGEHPCGECIGEILEGHGLTELEPYYAKAIAHKVGSQHETHLQEIIDSMYPETQ